MRHDPDRPGAVDIREQPRHVVDEPGLVMERAAVRRSFYRLLQLAELRLDDLVEVDEFGIGVVDHFDFRRRLCEEDRSPAEEWFAVEGMLGNQPQDFRRKLLLAAVIR